MDGSQPLDTRLIDALQGSYPQLQVGVHGVFHKDGNVHSLERVGQVLHGKGVGRRACAHPEDVDAILQAELHVLGLGHFGGREHAGFFLHLLHPRQGGLAVALESSRLGAGLPHAGTEHVAAFLFQLAGGGHHLLLGLGTAGTCNDDGAFVVTWQIQWFQFEFHIILI